eukprot:scaffold8.g1717.t1
MIWTELQHAANNGDAALAADLVDKMPLHRAAARGHAAASELLLAAASKAASAGDSRGWRPLHVAAENGHTAVVELLLDAAPETEQHRTNAGRSALYLAAHCGHLPAARVLVERSAAPPAELIANLLTAVDAPRPRGSLATLEQREESVHALIVDLAARRALSPPDWALLPTPCPALARALPAVLARSLVEAAKLVARLPDKARSRLRALALSLARLQRRLRLELPESVVRRILAAAPLEEEQEVDIAEGSGTEEKSEGERGSSDEE